MQIELGCVVVSVSFFSVFTAKITILAIFNAMYKRTWARARVCILCNNYTLMQFYDPDETRLGKFSFPFDFISTREK